MRMKAEISVFEAIITIILLLTAIAIFFPGFTYESRWSEAILLLKSRDIILTLDRLNKTHNSSFVKDFLEEVLEPDIIYWTEREGTFKDVIEVACNCTDLQILNITKWIGTIKLNEREIFLNFIKVNDLNRIPYSDVLLIWGYKELTPYKSSLKNYLKEGNGIVEIMDFEDETQIDEVQIEIFGIKWLDNQPINRRAEYDQFNRKPSNASDIIYNPYKYFYHIPILLWTEESDVTDERCTYSPLPSGNLTFNDTYYAFWVCNDNLIYFDTDGDGVNDTKVELRKNFVVGGYNFFLNYINKNYIAVSFRPVFKFRDFLISKFQRGQSEPVGFAWGQYYSTQVYPSDNDEERILLNASFQDGVTPFLPVSILNQYEMGRTAWIADFSNDVNFIIGDDQKLILGSLLLWASNKRSLQPPYNIKTGYLTSYINMVNKDMFEVYKFSLGLGYPY